MEPASTALAACGHTLQVFADPFQQLQTSGKAIGSKVCILNETNLVTVALSRFAAQVSNLTDAIGAQDTDSIEVIEEFTGKLLHICGDSARIALTDSEGREAFANCKAKDLLSQGINEGGRFRCIVQKTNDSIVLTYEAIPRRKLSVEEMYDMRRQIAEDIVEYDIADEQ
jgi:hypothetical protein